MISPSPPRGMTRTRARQWTLFAARPGLQVSNVASENRFEVWTAGILVDHEVGQEFPLILTTEQPHPDLRPFLQVLASTTVWPSSGFFLPSAAIALKPIYMGIG